MRYLMISLIGLMLAGCAGVGADARLAMMSYEVMNGQPTLRLCEVYGNKARRNEKIKTLLTERAAVKHNEWKLVDNETIMVGMSTCGLLSSWGRPRYINRNSNGRDRWVYQNKIYGNPYNYVYVEGGEIVSW